jgi:hypothetical protein
MTEATNKRDQHANRVRSTRAGGNSRWSGPERRRVKGISRRPPAGIPNA